MTLPWRTGVMLMLMLLSSAEASLNEPVICYILDGVLILYSIITTVLFFKVKWCQSVPEPEEESTYAELLTGPIADDYEDLRTDQTAATRQKHRQEASSDTYQALQVKDDESDAYQVIKSKGRTRKKDKAKKAQVPQDLRPGPPPRHHLHTDLTQSALGTEDAVDSTGSSPLH
ncbi:T-cell surface glycoprotein CD3 zeta chain-like [Coregonus clupeaformis]|uniref:T-cell surface glycoprotein CD3 zeta chain-like n=1 Tax=Coregonus clupeaformis TaxID=59861 RepID=UPI001BDFD6F5|nr:T-cell surface glycoprotein CD3 zeta chain-like [Coregonus clupeaformis]